jgi:hypothetical protein
VKAFPGRDDLRNALVALEGKQPTEPWAAALRCIVGFVLKLAGDPHSHVSSGAETVFLASFLGHKPPQGAVEVPVAEAVSEYSRAVENARLPYLHGKPLTVGQVDAVAAAVRKKAAYSIVPSSHSTRSLNESAIFRIHNRKVKEALAMLRADGFRCFTVGGVYDDGKQYDLNVTMVLITLTGRIEDWEKTTFRCWPEHEGRRAPVGDIVTRMMPFMLHDKSKLDDPHAESYVPPLAPDQQTQRKSCDEKTRINLEIAKRLGDGFLEFNLCSDGTDAVFGRKTGAAGRMADAHFEGEAAASRGAIHTNRCLSHAVDSCLKHSVMQTSGSYKGSNSKKTTRIYDILNTIARLLKPLARELKSMGLLAPQEDCSVRWAGVMRGADYVLSNWATLTAVIMKAPKGFNMDSNTEAVVAHEEAKKGKRSSKGSGAPDALRLLTTPSALFDLMALDAAFGTAREAWHHATPLALNAKLMLDLDDGLLASDYWRIIHRLLQAVEHRLAGIEKYGIGAHPLNPLSSTLDFVDQVFDAKEDEEAPCTGEDGAPVTRDACKREIMLQTETYLLNFRRKFLATIYGPTGELSLTQLFLGLLWGPTREDAAKRIVLIRKAHPRREFPAEHAKRKKTHPLLWKIWAKHKATFFRLAGSRSLPVLGKRRGGDGNTREAREATTEEIDALVEAVWAVLGGLNVGGKPIESTMKAFKNAVRSSHGAKSAGENKPLYAVFFGGTTASDGYFSLEGPKEEVDAQFAQVKQEIRQENDARNAAKKAEAEEFRASALQGLKDGVVKEAVAGAHEGYEDRKARGQASGATRAERLNSQRQ